MVVQFQVEVVDCHHLWVAEVAADFVAATSVPEFDAVAPT